MNGDFKRPLGTTNNEPVTKVPVTEPATTRPQPVVKEKKKYSKALSFVSVLLLLAILGAGIMSYFWYDQSQKLEAVRDELSAAENTIPNSRNKSAVPAEDTVPTATDDKALIIAAVTAAVNAPVSAKDSKVTVNVMKQGAEFAYTNAAFEGGGGAAYILKKIDDTWTVIFSGQEAVDQETIDRYGIPAEYRSGQ